jgi:hypothetical protein
MRRARRLLSAEGRRLVRALVLLLEVDIRLRLTGFARVQAALTRPAEGPGVKEQGSFLPEEAHRMSEALRSAAPYLPRARCLHRALALLLWLRRRGVAAELCMGVRLQAGEEGRPAGGPRGETGGEIVEGHAWVEWRGVPLDEDRAVCETFGRFEPHGRRQLTDTPQRP